MNMPTSRARLRILPRAVLIIVLAVFSALGVVPAAWSSTVPVGFGLNDNGQIGGGAYGGVYSTPSALPLGGAFLGQTVTGISTGANHTLAIGANFQVFAWGDDTYGQLGINVPMQTVSPAPPPRPTPGAYPLPFQVMVADTSQTPPLKKNVVSVAAGLNHSLALAEDGTVWAWGDNSYGQLGDGPWKDGAGNNQSYTSGPEFTIATKVAAPKPITAIAAGDNFCLLLASDGTVYAFGANSVGELGNGPWPDGNGVNQVYTAPPANSSIYNAPVQVNSTGALKGKVIVAIAAQGTQCLALDSIGGVYQWGSTDVTGIQNVPAVVPITNALQPKIVTAIAAGTNHALALTVDGLLFTWGDDSFGQLGDGFTGVSMPLSTDPGQPLAGVTITAITAGNNHSLALASDGTLYAWGDNEYGQLGNGDLSVTEFDVPTISGAVGALKGRMVNALIAGADQSFAITGDGARTWGYNGYGQLGTNTTLDTNQPTLAFAGGALQGKVVVQVAAGLQHTVALTSDGRVYTWGDNSFGQLGTGNNISSTSAVPVVISGVLTNTTVTPNVITKIKAVAAGYYYTLALGVDGNVYSWGDNSSGQLGNADGGFAPQNAPVLVSTTAITPATGTQLGKGATVAIQAGPYHALARDGAGNLYAWGDNSSGELSHATFPNPGYMANQKVVKSPIPLLVQGLPVKAAAMSAGGASNGPPLGGATGFSLALGANGKLYSWGDNAFGELGTDNTTQSSSPVAVNVTNLNGRTIKQISAGQGAFALLLTTDGLLYSWGGNTYGQLGNNTYGPGNVSLLPQPVVMNGALAGKTIQAISAGLLHSLAVADGKVYSWGWNQYGQLGTGINGQGAYSLVPAAAAPGALSVGTVYQVSAGGYQSVATTAKAVGGPSPSATVDFNGDGNNDIVLQNLPTGQIALWYLSGVNVIGGDFLSNNPGPEWHVVGVGNFGDGQPDLVLQNQTTSQVAIYYIAGPTLVGGAYVDSNPGPGWNVVAVADMNGDGLPDLVLQNQGTGQVIVWYLNGAHVVSGAYLSINAGTNWLVVGASDFNGDGNTDLVLQNQTSGQIVIWYLGPAPAPGGTINVTSGVYLTSDPGPNYAVVAVNDFNLDGHPDLILQNQTTGGLIVWYGNNNTITSGGYFNLAAPAGYVVSGPH